MVHSLFWMGRSISDIRTLSPIMYLRCLNSLKGWPWSTDMSSKILTLFGWMTRVRFDLDFKVATNCGNLWISLYPRSSKYWYEMFLMDLFDCSATVGFVSFLLDFIPIPSAAQTFLTSPGNTVPWSTYTFLVGFSAIISEQVFRVSSESFVFLAVGSIVLSNIFWRTSRYLTPLLSLDNLSLIDNFMNHISFRNLAKALVFRTLRVCGNFSSTMSKNSGNFELLRLEFWWLITIFPLNHLLHYLNCVISVVFGAFFLLKLSFFCLFSWQFDWKVSWA